jgi:cell division protein FtsB
MKGNRRRATNAIEVNFVVRMLVFGFLTGMAALFFVYLKNQQHAVGNKSRIVEQQFHEYEARNTALEARITSMTSRGYLQRKLDEGYIRLEAVRDTAVARITPPASAEPDGVLRTASREPATGGIAGAPQRVLRR